MAKNQILLYGKEGIRTGTEMVKKGVHPDDKLNQGFHIVKSSCIFAVQDGSESQAYI
jgi:hypothetical protein